jgi:hypothetical protein
MDPRIREDDGKISRRMRVKAAESPILTIARSAASASDAASRISTGVVMLRLIALYGVAAGLIVAIPMNLMMLNTPPGTMPENGMLYGYLTMIVGLTAVFLGVKHYRDKVLGGAIRFWAALLLGLGISTIASLLYVIAWELTLALSDLDFAESYAKAMVEAARAKGPSPAELEKTVADAAAFVEMYRNPLYRIPITFIEMFPVGVLISLISAGLLRDSRLLPARAHQGIN